MSSIYNSFSGLVSSCYNQAGVSIDSLGKNFTFLTQLCGSKAVTCWERVIQPLKTSNYFSLDQLPPILRSKQTYTYLGFAVSAMGVAYFGYKYFTNRRIDQRIEDLERQAQARREEMRSLNQRREQLASRSSGETQPPSTQVQDLETNLEAENRGLTDQLRQAQRSLDEQRSHQVVEVKGLQDRVAQLQAANAHLTTQLEQAVGAFNSYQVQFEAQCEKLLTQLSERIVTYERNLTGLKAQLNAQAANIKQLASSKIEVIREKDREISSLKELCAQQQQSLQSKQEVSSDQLRLATSSSAGEEVGTSELLTLSGFEEIDRTRFDIPDSFRKYISDCCPNLVVEDAYVLSLFGKQVYDRIQSQPHSTIETEERKYSVVLPLIWFLMTNKGASKEVMISLSDKDQKVFNLLKKAPGVYNRISSHYTHLGVQQYGLDFLQDKAEQFGLSLPAGKTTLLFFYNSDEKMLHIKPEDYGLNNLRDAIPHIWQYVRNKTKRALPNLLGSPDDEPYMSKEHLPDEVRKAFLNIESLLNKEAKHFSQQPTVFSILADLSEWVESDLQKISDEAATAIFKFISDIRARGWDHLEKRYGNEKLLTESDINPLPSNNKRPDPLAYLETLLRIRLATTLKEILDIINTSTGKPIPWVIRKAFIDDLNQKDEDYWKRQIGKDIHRLPSADFRIDGVTVSDLINHKGMPDLTEENGLSAMTDLLKDHLGANPIDRLKFLAQDIRNKMMEFINYTFFRDGHVVLSQMGSEVDTFIDISTRSGFMININKNFYLVPVDEIGKNTYKARIQAKVRVRFENVVPHVEWSWQVL